jgi:uncharacterized membrane protein YGL010W
VTLFDEYGAYHSDPRNRLCHEIGIPLIVLSLEALLRYVALGAIDLAAVVTIAVIAYYFTLVRAEAFLATAALIVLYLAAAFITWPYAIATFVAGWIFQFVGHAYEGKKPAFLTNVVHVLVGPLWIAHLAVERRHS